MKVLKKIKSYILFGLIIIPVIFIFIYLRSKGKSLQITPEFKVIDCKKEDLTGLQDAISVAQDILKKAQS